MFLCLCVFFFFKQKTAYEMRISDWSSDVCSSDLAGHARHLVPERQLGHRADPLQMLERQVQRHVAAGDGGGAGAAIGLQHVAIDQIGRASCRERVCQYVWISVVAVSLKKKQKIDKEVC